MGEAVMVKVMETLDNYFKIMRELFRLLQIVAPLPAVFIFLYYVHGSMPFIGQSLWGLFVAIGSWTYFKYAADQFRNNEIITLKITKEKMAQLLRDGKEPKEFDLVDGDLVVTEKVNES